MKQRLVVLGAGESGVGAAILGKDKGMDVFVSDMGTIAKKYRAVLEAEHIAYEQGQHTAGLIMNADMVVKSPGIPPTAPIIKALTDKGVPVLSEIELAGRYTDARMVCITGSNGKTTTTMLTHHILSGAGIDAGLAGNVGRSLALQVAREPHEVYVIELSSFQLENMYDFRADVAVLLNITPDHLDRYGYDMQNYIDAKMRILRNQRRQDAFVFWQDDPVIRRQLESGRAATAARVYPLGEQRAEGTAAYVDGDGMLRVNTPATSLVMPRKDLALNGVHNLYNSMAAALCACIIGVGAEDVRRGLETFGGVEHRLERCGTVDGVLYINDSKATNVNSCYYALGSMPESKTTVLILGGKDKGNDYDEIAPLVDSKVKAIVCMGKDNTKLLEYFGGRVAELRDTHSLTEAVAACRAIACAGDTVLLSPCCASFDLFRSYEDRGEQFKAAVARL